MNPIGQVQASRGPMVRDASGPSHIQGIMHSLAAAIERAEAQGNEVEARLASVLRMPEPERTAASAPAVGTMTGGSDSELARFLDEMRVRVETLTARNESILNRVQL